MVKGLRKCGHETGLLVRSLRFPCLVVPNAEDVQHDSLQTCKLILKISSYHDIKKMKILRISRQSTLEGGKVFSPTHRAPLHPTWYSFLLEPESTPGPWCGRKYYVNEKFRWSHRAYSAVPRLTATPHGHRKVIITPRIEVYPNLWRFLLAGMWHRVLLCFVMGARIFT
jgi:hypothetical protein